MTTPPAPLLDVALTCLAAGRSVMAIAPGQKTPSTVHPTTGEITRLSWKGYQAQRPTEEQIRQWFPPDTLMGMGIACGPVSGVTIAGVPYGLEVIDVDDAETLAEFVEAANWQGLSDLLQRLLHQRTPGGAGHFAYCCAEWAGNTVLARRPGKPGEPQFVTLIETRGAGGQVVVAPTPPGIHPEHPERGYELVRGSWERLPIITPAERQALGELARSFNTCVTPSQVHTPPGAGGPMATGTRPGDTLNQTASRDWWHALLERHAWTCVHRRGDIDYWQRPGKDGKQWSATLGACGPYFYVFSTNAAPFEPERAYSAFSVYTLLEHDGDFTAAARALALSLPTRSMRTQRAQGQQGLASSTDAANEPPPMFDVEMWLASLATTPEPERLHGLAEAMETLGTLDAVEWMLLKPKLKAHIPGVNMNDIERAWTQRHKEHQARLAATRRAEGQAPRQDQLAGALATQWAGTTAFDVAAQEWFTYANGRWAPTAGAFIEQRIITYMDTEAPGYTWNTLHGVERLLHAKLAATLSLETPGWLPFRNGALQLGTMQLHAHCPERPFLWQLPYAYDPTAPCPSTQQVLHEMVGHDHGQVQLLRAFMKAAVTRRVDLQRYLENVGPGGTGKGTYMRLLTALVGRENVFITELKHLESNRFETSGLQHKLLMLVTDAERYSGPVNQLKAITGQDEVRIERKFRDVAKDFVPVMVCVSANEPIQSADYTSGLTRRRIAMAFRHKPPQPQTLLEWQHGGWVGALAAEIPGVLNWVMALPDEEVTRLLRHTETAVPTLQDLARKAIVDTNPLADWANHHLIVDDAREEDGRLTARVNVGTARKAERSDRYENEYVWLYPNYKAWAESTGNRPVSNRRFATILEDLVVNQLGFPVEYHNDNTGSHFRGVRLRPATSQAQLLFYTTDMASVLDGTDSVTDETRTSDGCDGCDAFLKNLSIPATPPPSVDTAYEDTAEKKSERDKGGWGGPIGRSEIPKIRQNPSHPSLARVSGVPDPSSSVTSPAPQDPPPVPYKGGPCPRPGCDGTVLMREPWRGCQLYCLCGWDETRAAPSQSP
jgi:phage/plasmid-associated DNA primase